MHTSNHDITVLGLVEPLLIYYFNCRFLPDYMFYQITYLLLTSPIY